VLRLRFLRNKAEEGKNSDNAFVCAFALIDSRAGTAEVTGDVRLKSIERAILHKLPLSGIPGVNKVLRDHKKSQLLGFAHYNAASKGIDMGVEEWFFETEGSNLLATLALPGVDARRTICNDIKEVLQVRIVSVVRCCCCCRF